MRTAPSVVSGEVEDLVPFRGPLTGEHVELVVAVEVDLVGRGPDLLPLLQLVGDVESPAAATKVGNQSSPEKMPFWTLPAGTLPGQRTIAGTRKPPSITVPLPPAKGVWPPSGQVKFSAPLSVLNPRMVLSSRPALSGPSVDDEILARAIAFFAPARLLGRIVLVGREAGQHGARADLVLERLRVVRMIRVL